jgi:predicted cobalt transporter CbtA
LSIYLTDDSLDRAERATLKFRYPSRRRVAEMIAEEFGMPAHANPPRMGDEGYEPSDGYDRMMARARRNRTLLFLALCSAAFAIFLVLCALAGLAAARGGWR